MIKLFQVVVCMCIFINTAFGQKISDEVFNKSIDKLNCLVIENSIKESQKQWSCNCSLSPNFDVIVSSIPAELSNTIALSKEINKIKEENVPSSKEDLIKFLTDKVFLNNVKYSKLFAFAKSRERADPSNEWKKTLKTNLSNIDLQESNGQIPPAIEGDKQPAVKEVPFTENNGGEKQTEKNKWTDIFTFKIDVISFLMITVLFFIVFRLFKLVSTQETSGTSKLVSDSVKNYVNEKIGKASIPSQGNLGIGKSTNEISRLKDDINLLRKDIDTLFKKWSEGNVRSAVNTLGESNAGAQGPSGQSKTIYGEIFLSKPNNDGSFNDSSASNVYREGASIYRFVKTSSNEANFQIDDRESSIQMALQFPDKNILPVCESENEFEPKYSKVKIIEAGQVVLEGGKWYVKIKAKIRYES